MFLVLVSLAGCGGGSDDGGREELAADTARFTFGDRTVTVPLAECGRDGDVVLAAGTSGDVVLQVAADLGEGGADRTAVTGDVGEDGIWGAFGADAGVGPGPAGEITRVTLEGDRLTVEGRWARLDDDLAPDPATAPVDGRLVARCPASTTPAA